MLAESSALIIAIEGISQLGLQLADQLAPRLPFQYPLKDPRAALLRPPATERGDPYTLLPLRLGCRRGGARGGGRALLEYRPPAAAPRCEPGAGRSEMGGRSLLSCHQRAMG